MSLTLGGEYLSLLARPCLPCEMDSRRYLSPSVPAWDVVPSRLLLKSLPGSGTSSPPLGSPQFLPSFPFNPVHHSPSGTQLDWGRCAVGFNGFLESTSATTQQGTCPRSRRASPALSTAGQELSMQLGHSLQTEQVGDGSVCVLSFMTDCKRQFSHFG